MKRIYLFVLTALMMLMSTSAMAQSETIKGDVNGDGVVDVADIAAVIKIMTNNGDIQKKYYWYVGQENPANMTSISPIVDDNTSPGWRLIGTSIPEYNISNKLWDGVTNGITFNARDIYYYVVPSNNIKIYDDTGASVMDVFTTSEVTIEGVKYYVYTSNSKARGIAWMVY